MILTFPIREACDLDRSPSPLPELVKGINVYGLPSVPIEFICNEMYHSFTVVLYDTVWPLIVYGAKKQQRRINH